MWDYADRYMGENKIKICLLKSKDDDGCDKENCIFMKILNRGEK